MYIFTLARTTRRSGNRRTGGRLAHEQFVLCSFVLCVLFWTNRQLQIKLFITLKQEITMIFIWLFALIARNSPEVGTNYLPVGPFSVKFLLMSSKTNYPLVCDCSSPCCSPSHSTDVLGNHSLLLHQTVSQCIRKLTVTSFDIVI